MIALHELAIQRAMSQAADQFTPGFDDWLRMNWRIYLEFEAQAHRMIKLGRKHYSAKTIIEYMRHWKALRDADHEFKINNNVTSDLARFFALRNPKNKDLFTYRISKNHRKQVGESHGR